ncbi:transcriptional regulator, partial [Paenibacillus apiarius]|nr:transcriptional regulator [Paenibacillus apiarius]MCY9523098.1 transcriptional regulator [Paenibacillus apiarius]MCY9553948.1 transcriptional regulator [Paenibacillus apiarius]
IILDSPYSFVTDNVKLMTGFINGKTGNIDLAIAQFKKYLDDPSSYNLIHAVTELLELYLNKNDLLAANQLLLYEDELTESISQPHTTPYKKSRLAYYYRIKGQLLLRNNQEKDAFDSLLISTLKYAKIGRFTEAFDSLSFITQTMMKDSSIINSEMIQKIDVVFKTIKENN